MKMHKKNILFLALPFVLFSTLALSSCAGVSQYGTDIKLNFTNGTTNPKPFGDGQYSFDAFNGSVYKDKKIFNTSDNLDFLYFFQYIETIRLFIDNLVSGIAHIDDALPNNIISFDHSSSGTDNKKIHEFMLASANILNQGGSNDLKFGINELKIKMPDTKDVFLQSNGTTNTTTELTILDPNKKILATKATMTGFTVEATFGYYDAGNTDIFNNSVKKETVNQYVKQGNIWSYFPDGSPILATEDSWNIVFPLETKFRMLYTTSKDISSKKYKDPVTYDKNTDKITGLDVFITQPNGLNPAWPKSTFLELFPTASETFDDKSTMEKNIGNLNLLINGTSKINEILKSGNGADYFKSFLKLKTITNTP